MPNLLVTVKISKGFKTWTEMAKSMEEKAGSEGAKVIWAAANPDETSIYVMMDVPNPEFMQTFGLREDVKKLAKTLALMFHQLRLLLKLAITGYQISLILLLA